MKIFVCLLLVIGGMAMISVGCFHPEVSRSGSLWSGLIGGLFVVFGYAGIMNMDN
jgi:hypothetical protein